jgi:HD superfamily phosphohydrolase
MIFSDIIYGQINISDWLLPFLKIPEFVRLRGVRLSNVDSYEFKDFNGPTRWEHCIGVAHLALKLSKKKNLSKTDSVHLQLAALLHDVATPPFAHTVEYIMAGYDHEFESNKILSASDSDNISANTPIYLSQLPQFRDFCVKVSKQIKIKINPDTVAEMVTGSNELGFLINGSIDLDNIDNVIRSSLFLGINIDKTVSYGLVEWLSKFDTVPSDLENETNEHVRAWLRYRNQMYSKFYSSHEEELGRQAFLQHLIRRAYKLGMSKASIIWNTDEGLLQSIEKFPEKHFNSAVKNIYKSSISLEQLVQRYRLLESAHKVIEIPIDNALDFKVIKNPEFSSWFEDELTTTTFEPFVIVNEKRFSDQSTLFTKEGGLIQVYKLSNTELKHGQLPEWIQNQIPNDVKMIQTKTLNKIAAEKVRDSLKSKPWLKLTEKRKDSIKFNLENIGNWGFRLSKNEGLHSYPATFVHAIPATLINALCLKGEYILDPFGGTGQTAVEAVKNGCKVISSDSNSIATLIAKAKLTYLTKPQRLQISSITTELLASYNSNLIPAIPDINKWHHKKTQGELSKILNFIENQEDKKLGLFYSVCFSDILTYCTARKGKEHGYFADNTPLSKTETSPPYENALIQFVNKAKRNITIIEKFYSHFERNGLSVKDELSNCKILQKDITKAGPAEFNVENNSVAGIITSPPYLCMADYTLGQRLSYYWLFPDKLTEDFQNEIGSRRSRMKNGIALEKYFEAIKQFADNAYCLLKPNGFMATVIGAPVAKAYNNNKILHKIDNIFKDAGFNLFWHTTRPINWHRNHGYARLKDERIAVHIKK